MLSLIDEFFNWLLNTKSSVSNNQIQKKIINQAHMEEEIHPILEELMTSPIDDIFYKTPIIASDLHIYDLDEYLKLYKYHQFNKSKAEAEAKTMSEQMFGKMGSEAQFKSPLTTEPFETQNFPVVYDRLQYFNRNYQHTRSHKLLFSAATCPITYRIMQDPVIVDITCQFESMAKPAHFALVCDSSTLKVLPKEFRLIKQRSYNEMKAAIRTLPKKRQQEDPPREITSGNWYAAINKIAQEFPTLKEKNIQRVPGCIEPRSSTHHFFDGWQHTGLKIMSKISLSISAREYAIESCHELAAKDVNRFSCREICQFR